MNKKDVFNSIIFVSGGKPCGNKNIEDQKKKRTLTMEIPLLLP